ncbi:leucine-rich repeat-domain-containing protein [Blakeslea trispora]|nr:leucine-rich repeat-domain-containing protein [Blakeslea trispora]
MKLTADLLANSLSHINPLGQRELVLRDLKIPAIENLGVTKASEETEKWQLDLNDAIDFTNNDLRVLGNFPRLNRLQHLFLNSNRISKIDHELNHYVPNLQTIILSNNSISELGDLEALVECKKLTHLSLLDNPVTKKKHYRLYLIHKLPQLRVLDFNKVKLAEKKEAAALFLKTDGSENDLAKSITDNKTKTFEPGEGLHQEHQGHGLTPDEQLKIKASESRE